MPYQDYHRLYLDQSVWDRTEKHLRPSVRSALLAQVKSRFPNASAVYVLGDLTTNYWDEDSDLDILVAVPKSDIKKYSAELPIINGRELLTRYSPIPGELDQKTPITKNHGVYWYLVSEQVLPQVLSEKFGRLYEILSDIWYGTLTPGKSQMGNPKTLLQMINWMLFKYKHSSELYPEVWTFVFTGFNLLSNSQKLEVIDALKMRANRIDRLLRTRLTKYPAQIWKQLEMFEDRLENDDDEDLAPAALQSGDIPESLLFLVLHRWRYLDLANRLEEMADKEADARKREETMRGLPINASAEAGFAQSILTRLNTFFTAILSATNDVPSEVLIRLFMFILDNNRYMRAPLQRRRVALALYRHYVQGK